MQGHRKTLCFRVYESPPQRAVSEQREMCEGVWDHNWDPEHDKGLIRAQLWSTHNGTAFSPMPAPLWHRLVGQPISPWPLRCPPLHCPWAEVSSPPMKSLMKQSSQLCRLKVAHCWLYFSFEIQCIFLETYPFHLSKIFLLSPLYLSPQRCKAYNS